MTPKEINEAVALKLGWKRGIVARTLIDNHPVKGWIDPWGNPSSLGVPDYCGSIAAAWEIVEWCGNKDFDVTIHLFPAYGSGSKEFGCAIANECWKAVADTAPMAICLAFLKLEVPKP